MKFIDVCCGIGGFHQALKNMGFDCVMACDIDENCRDVYELNYHIRPEGDLTKIKVETIPNFDILCAGFPCQPFSKAGHQTGFKDSRGNIFFELCKIISHHSPQYIILENVRNLSSHDKGNTWNVIKTTLDELNYHVCPLTLNALYFGVPQSRERVVILCKRKDLGEIRQPPQLKKRETSLLTIVEDSVPDTYTLSKKMKETSMIWDTFIALLKEHQISIPKFPLWTDWWDKDPPQEFYLKYKNWIDKNRAFYTNHPFLSEWLHTSRSVKEWMGAVRKMEWQAGNEHLNMDEVLWSSRGSGIRVKKIDYAPTLVAMTSMIPIYKNRQLTPRECARLQSFPENFILPKDKIAYKQFGNAVNVKMIEKSARFLIFDEPLDSLI